MKSPEALEFLQSLAARQYMDDFPEATRRALDRLDFSGIVIEDNALYFCQLLWEELPDSEYIRQGAFFTICDFAEQYCFGGGD